MEKLEMEKQITKQSVFSISEWILRYLNCLMNRHIFIAINWEGSNYRYCLRCSKVTQPSNNEMKVNL
jgi:hypothetical protein